MRLSLGANSQNLSVPFSSSITPYVTVSIMPVCVMSLIVVQGPIALQTKSKNRSKSIHAYDLLILLNLVSSIDRPR